VGACCCCCWCEECLRLRDAEAKCCDPPGVLAFERLQSIFLLTSGRRPGVWRDRNTALLLRVLHRCCDCRCKCITLRSAPLRGLTPLADKKGRPLHKCWECRNTTLVGLLVLIENISTPQDHTLPSACPHTTSSSLLLTALCADPLLPLSPPLQRADQPPPPHPVLLLLPLPAGPPNHGSAPLVSTDCDVWWWLGRIEGDGVGVGAFVRMKGSSRSTAQQQQQSIRKQGSKAGQATKLTLVAIHLVPSITGQPACSDLVSWV